MVVEQFFYDGGNMNDIGKRAHVLNHSFGRCVIVFLDKILHEGSIWNVRRAVPSFILHISVFLNFVNNGTRFYKNIYVIKELYIYIDDDRSGVFPTQEVRKKYNSEYQLTYSNPYYVMKNGYIKDTRTRRTYSGRKRKATGYALITRSPYCDAGGSSQLR